MDEALRAYDELKDYRGVKKSLLTRSINKLRTVASRGKDAQAVISARRRARYCIEELDEINVQIETTLLPWDIAFEVDEHDVTSPTARMIDIEKNIEEISIKEAEIDTLHSEWLEGRVTETAAANAKADVFAKTLEALMITDKLKSQKTNPSIRTGMNPPPQMGWPL